MTASRRRPTRRAIPAIALILIAVAASHAACAAAPCYPRTAFHAHLAERYGERPVGVGVMAGHLVEFLTRPDGVGWTILVIRPDGPACAVAAGEDWIGVAVPTPAPGERSP